MDIFHRFVKTFPELLDADEALRIWKCLHAPGPASGEGSLRFGVRELSVSMQAGGEVRLRWLAEAFERQPFQRSTAEQARSIAHCVFETLRDLEAAYLPLDRFDRLFDLAYPLSAAGAARPGFRLGYAIDLQEGETPSFKWYAEPRTTGAEGAAERFFAIAEAQGLLEHLRHADAAIRGRLPGAAFRGFGTDLCVRDIPNLKVYYSVRGCDWKQLLAACATNAQGPGAAALERFHRLVLKGRARVPSNTILLGVVLDPDFDPGAPDLRWDVFLPQLHTGDGLLQAPGARRFQTKVPVAGSNLEIDALAEMPGVDPFFDFLTELSAFENKAPSEIFGFHDLARTAARTLLLVDRRRLPWKDLGRLTQVILCSRATNEVRRRLRRQQLRPGVWEGAFVTRVVVVEANHLELREEALAVLVHYATGQKLRDAIEAVVSRGQTQYYGVLWLLRKHIFQGVLDTMSKVVDETMIDIREALEELGIEHVVDVIGLDRVVGAVGLDRVVEAVGLDRVVREIGPERMIEAIGLERVKELVRKMEKAAAARPTAARRQPARKRNGGGK